MIMEMTLAGLQGRCGKSFFRILLTKLINGLRIYAIRIAIRNGAIARKRPLKKARVALAEKMARTTTAHTTTRKNA